MNGNEEVISPIKLFEITLKDTILNSNLFGYFLFLSIILFGPILIFTYGMYNNATSIPLYIIYLFLFILMTYIIYWIFELKNILMHLCGIIVMPNYIRFVCVTGSTDIWYSELTQIEVNHRVSLTLNNQKQYWFYIPKNEEINQLFRYVKWIIKTHKNTIDYIPKNPLEYRGDKVNKIFQNTYNLCSTGKFQHLDHNIHELLSKISYLEFCNMICSQSSAGSSFIDMIERNNVDSCEFFLFPIIQNTAKPQQQLNISKNFLITNSNLIVNILLEMKWNWSSQFKTFCIHDIKRVYKEGFRYFLQDHGTHTFILNVSEEEFQLLQKYFNYINNYNGGI